MEACLVVLRGAGREGQPADTTVYRPPRPALWRVPDALDRIQAVLADHPEGGELTLFLPALPGDDPQRDLKARAAVASTLLAGLEARPGWSGEDRAGGRIRRNQTSSGWCLKRHSARSRIDLTRPPTCQGWGRRVRIPSPAPVGIGQTVLRSARRRSEAQV